MEESIKNEIFSESPSLLISLFRISLDKKSRGSNYYFHGGENGYNESIFYKSKPYFHVAMKADGFDSASNEFPRPTLTFDNTDSFFSLKTRFFEDFVGYQVTRIRTFSKFLSNNNFPNNINPHGTPTEDSFPEEKYVINQKTQENSNIISFELSSLMEKENSFLPNRKVVYNVCQWLYRHPIGCGYSGPPLTDSKGNLFENLTAANPIDYNDTKTYHRNEYIRIRTRDNLSPVDSYYVCLKNNTIGKSPETDRDHWIADACPKNIAGCRARYGHIEQQKGLPFGGFPGSWK